MMEPEMYEKLSNTIRRDAMVLESFKIMDYSLLVGLHRPGIDENANDEIHRRKVHESVQRREAPLILCLFS